MKKHRRLADSFRSIMRRPGCVWKESTAKSSPCSSKGKQVDVISDLDSVKNFLVSVRRLPLLAGVHCRFGALNSKDLSSSKMRVTRYGRVVGRSSVAVS